MSEPVDRLLARLDRARSVGPGRWIARCPAHEDRRPSLSIREGEDGRVLVYCFAGCGADAVISAAGLDWRDLFTESERRRTEPGATVRRRRCAPRIPASDALEILGDEADALLFAVADLEQGRPLAEVADDIRLAAGRIAAVRAAWAEAP